MSSNFISPISPSDRSTKGERPESGRRTSSDTRTPGESKTSFKKILDDKSKVDEEGGDEISLIPEGEIDQDGEPIEKGTKTKSPHSVFDLAEQTQKKKVKNGEGVLKEGQEELSSMSRFDSSSNSKVSGSKQKGEKTPNIREKKSENKGENAPSVAQSPIFMHADGGRESSLDMERSSDLEKIHEVVGQLVEKLEVLSRGDLRDTQVTLRAPPILEGATVTLSTTTHASKEFNIAFANLSPEGQLFLDAQLNKRSLVDELQKKGFVVHMLSTTQNPEPLKTTPGESFDNRKGGDQKEGRREGDQQGGQGRSGQQK